RPLPSLTEGVVSLALIDPDDAPLAVFEISGGSTGDGFAALADGRAEIVLADRDLTMAERALLLERGLGDLSAPERRRLVARRELSLFAGSAAEKVPSLPAAQLPAVLSGDITSWAALGGEDVPINPGVLAEKTGALEARVAGLTGLGEPFALSVKELASEGEAESFLNGDPGALVVAQSALPLGQRIGLSGACNRGIVDVLDEAADPLRLDLWAYTAAPRLSDIARAFLVFATGPDAQRVVDRAGFLDKRPRPVPLGAQGIRVAQAVLSVETAGDLEALQSALSRLSGLERLSVTFRFEEGDAPILTGLSESEARILASLIDSGAFDGQSLLFAGFVNSAVDGEIGRRLSEAQARVALEAVQAATLTRFDRVEMLAQGMGALFPLACDDTGWASQVNRRVEVWLGPGPVPID
ncbi:MAG: substrate-binding domain-containing protein, partial [Pseudomonadota bacterium]